MFQALSLWSDKLVTQRTCHSCLQALGTLEYVCEKSVTMAQVRPMAWELNHSTLEGHACKVQRCLIYAEGDSVIDDASLALR